MPDPFAGTPAAHWRTGRTALGAFPAMQPGFRPDTAAAAQAYAISWLVTGNTDSRARRPRPREFLDVIRLLNRAAMRRG